MTPAQFDPVAFKADQRAAWEAISPGWGAWQDEFECGAASGRPKGCPQDG